MPTAAVMIKAIRPIDPSGGVELASSWRRILMNQEIPAPGDDGVCAKVAGTSIFLKRTASS